MRNCDGKNGYHTWGNDHRLKAYILLFRATFNQQHDQLRPKSAHAYTPRLY